MAGAAAGFRLLVLTPEHFYPREQAWVNRLFEAGLSCLQLRKPGWEEVELLRYLQEIEEQYHSRIMVHHSPPLLQKLNLGGLHLRNHALPGQKPAYRLSCPAHSWQEFLEVQHRVDWALLSPFFQSISKNGYAANEQLWAIPPEAQREKAIALGGINATNVVHMQKLGLGGAAVLGAVWQTDNPLEAFLALQEKIDHG